MKTSSVQLNFLHETYSVALYDMTIEDVKERFEKRLIFKKAVQAANFLGMIPGKFYERIAGPVKVEGEKRYAYHKTTGVKYAIRKISPLTQELK